MLACMHVWRKTHWSCMGAAATLRDKLVADSRFCLLHCAAGLCADQHGAVVEGQLVGLVLGQRKRRPVILRRHLVLAARCFRQTPVHIADCLCTWYVSADIYTHAHTCMHACTYAYTKIHLYIHKNKHTHQYTFVYIYRDSFTLSVHTFAPRTPTASQREPPTHYQACRGSG